MVNKFIEELRIIVEGHKMSIDCRNMIRENDATMVSEPMSDFLYNLKKEEISISDMTFLRIENVVNAFFGKHHDISEDGDESILIDTLRSCYDDMRSFDTYKHVLYESKPTGSAVNIYYSDFHHNLQGHIDNSLLSIRKKMLSCCYRYFEKKGIITY